VSPRGYIGKHRKPQPYIAAVAVAAVIAGGSWFAGRHTAPAAHTSPAAHTGRQTAQTDRQNQQHPRPQLPVLAMQHWTGIEPASLSFGGAADVTVFAIIWRSWGHHQATGTGITNVNDCNPDCADGTITTYSASITLSQPVHGRFTVLTEVINDAMTGAVTVAPTTAIFRYGSAEWPVGTAP